MKKLNLSILFAVMVFHSTQANAISCYFPEKGLSILFGLCKTALDGVTAYESVEQAHAVNDFRDSLSNVTCTKSLCTTNIGNLNKAGNNGYYGDYVVTAFSSLAALNDLVTLGVFVLASNANIVQPKTDSSFFMWISTAISGITLITAFAANGSLWGTKINNYLVDMPDDVVNSLNQAENRGVGVLVPPAIATLWQVIGIAVTALVKSRMTGTDPTAV